jgi:predicted aspartyl protease
MIRGIVSQLRPVVEITVWNALNQPVIVEAIMDTGFTGYVALPRSIIAQLGLPFTHPLTATLMAPRYTICIVCKVRNGDCEWIAVGPQ